VIFAVFLWLADIPNIGVLSLTLVFLKIVAVLHIQTFFVMCTLTFDVSPNVNFAELHFTISYVIY